MRVLKRVLWGSLMFALIVGLAGCSGGDREPPGGNPGETTADRVVFTVNPYFPPENPDFRDDVYTVRTDGSGLTRLTHSGNIGEARLSPDGDQVLYGEHHDGAAFRYYLTAVAGSERRLLTPEPVAGRVFWAADAGVVLYHERGDLVLVLVGDGDGRREVVPAPPGELTDFTLTPDGAEIWALIHRVGEGMSLFRRLVRGGEWKEAGVDSELPAGAWLGSFSSSGRYLLLGEPDDGRHRLRLLAREPAAEVFQTLGHLQAGPVHCWSADDRLAALAPDGIMVLYPGEREPALFWPREGVTSLVGWKSGEVLFTVRTPQRFLLARTDGRRENELVRLGALD